MNSIGRYQLLEKLGQGGMGVVYRAFDTLLHRVVAVKVIAGAIETSGEQRERFFREARAAGQLSHRNIITIHDLGEHEGQPYLAMEYLEGEDLQRRLVRPERMSLARKIELAIEICEGLDYAHARGVVHRDIKPANIFITDDGTVKILDFGLARLVTSQLTNSNMMMGTINYMAPEQVRGERADQRSDIFSVGVVLYELLGGRKAFDGDSFASTLYNILQTEPESLLSIEPGLPRDLVAIVERALAKPRDERYQQISELLTDLVLVRQQFAAYDSPLGRPALAGLGRRSDPPLPAPRPPSDVPTAAHRTPATPLPSPGVVRELPPAETADGPAARTTARKYAIAVALAVLAVAAGGMWAARTTDSRGSAGHVPAAEAAVVDQAPVAPERPQGTVPAREEPRQPTDDGAAERSGRQSADAARTRMNQAKADARLANAATLAGSAYRGALAAERAADQLYRAGQLSDATAKFYEASGLFQSAKLSALSEAAARAERATSSGQPARAEPANTAVKAPPPAPQPRAEPTTSDPPAPPPAAPPIQSPPVSPALETLPGERRGGAATPLPATPPPPAPPPEPSAERLIADLLDRYEHALEARSLTALKRLWPALSGSQESAIRNEFEHASRLAVDIVAPRIDVSGDTATATFTRRYEIVTIDGQRFSRPSLTTMRLRRGTSGWIIEQVRFEPVR